MYERCESEVNVGGNQEAGHICDGNIIILEVFQGRARTRGETRVMVVLANNGVLGDHPARTWRRNGVGL